MGVIQSKAPKTGMYGVRPWLVLDLEVENQYRYNHDGKNIETLDEGGEFEWCVEDILRRMKKDYLSSFSPILDGDCEEFTDCSCIGDESRVKQDPELDWVKSRPDYVMHVVDKEKGSKNHGCNHPYTYCFFAWYGGDTIYVRKHKTGKCNLCDYASDSEKLLTFTTTMTVDVVMKVTGNTEDALNEAISAFESSLKDRLDHVCEDTEEYLTDDHIDVEDYIKTNHSISTRSAGR